MLERIAFARQCLAQVSPAEIHVSPEDFDEIRSGNVLPFADSELVEDVTLTPGMFKFVFGPLS